MDAFKTLNEIIRRANSLSVGNRIQKLELVNTAYRLTILLYVENGGLNGPYKRIFEEATSKATQLLNENPGQTLRSTLVSYLELCENPQYRDELIMDTLTNSEFSSKIKRE